MMPSDPQKALVYFDECLATFAPKFDAELRGLAGGALSPYVAALAQAALGAARGTCALSAHGDDAAAGGCAAAALELFEVARAAATKQGAAPRGRRRGGG